jgi:hypothetical protein
MTTAAPPFVTIASIGYALITETPEGLVATMLSPAEAQQQFDNGTQYVPEVDSDALMALQAVL